MILTYREIMDCGAWDLFCELHGVSAWGVNEGGGDTAVNLTVEQAYRLGIVRQTKWKRKPFEETYPPHREAVLSAGYKQGEKRGRQMFKLCRAHIRFPLYMTGLYRVYIRLWPLPYFIARNVYTNRLVMVKKRFDPEWNSYRWKEI